MPPMEQMSKAGRSIPMFLLIQNGRSSLPGGSAIQRVCLWELVAAFHDLEPSAGRMASWFVVEANFRQMNALIILSGASCR